MVGRGARRDAEDRGAACAGGAARARAGAARRLPSPGQLLIIGPRDAALYWADALREQLSVTVLATGRAVGAELPAERAFPVYSGKAPALAGWLGAFERRVGAGESDRPRPVHALQRVHLARVPSTRSTGATRSTSTAASDHRACVAACGADRRDRFRAQRRRARASASISCSTCSASRGSRMHQPPQGYLRPGADAVAQAKAVADARRRSSANSRSRNSSLTRRRSARTAARSSRAARSASTCARRAAIRADGDRVAVEPHLCMGCGACTTVCPSGALALRVSVGARPRRGASGRCSRRTQRPAGATPACCFHAEDGRDAIARLARRGKGLPARVIPVEVHHIASVGLDVWLAALAYGASAGRGAGDRQRGAAVSRGARSPDADRRHHRPGARLPGRAFPRARRRDRRRARAALWSWPPALAVRVAGDLRRRARQAHDRRARDRASRAARAGAAAGDCAARRLAVRHASTSIATPARCASRASARAPKARSSTTSSAAGAVHRDEVRPVRDLRGDVPRARDRLVPRLDARRPRRARRGC